jgi:CheY-like chemotaxis protein
MMCCHPVVTVQRLHRPSLDQSEDAQRTSCCDRLLTASLLVLPSGSELVSGAGTTRFRRMSSPHSSPNPPSQPPPSMMSTPSSPSLSRQAILSSRIRIQQSANILPTTALPGVQPASTPTTPPHASSPHQPLSFPTSSVSMPAIRARTPSLTHQPNTVQTTPPSTSPRIVGGRAVSPHLNLSDPPLATAPPPGAGSRFQPSASARQRASPEPSLRPDPSPRRGPLNNFALHRRRGDSVDISPVEQACKNITENYRVLAAKMLADIGVIEWSPDQSLKRIMSEFAALQGEVERLKQENGRLKEQQQYGTSGMYPAHAPSHPQHAISFGGGGGSNRTTAFRSGHDRASSSSGLTPAMDMIDATASVYSYGEGGRDLSPASRHSLRASRRSLGTLPDGSMALPASFMGGAAGGAAGGGGSGGESSSRRGTKGRGRGKKVALIIDNNTLSQRLTSVALHRAGFTACDLAGEGETAISMVQSTRYELILLDANLPTLSGVETARAIRWMEDQRGDPPCLILIHTHSLDAASVEAYKQARLSGCLEKGCILAEAVSEACEILLGRNANFLCITAGGEKKQEPRTQEQETEELKRAMSRSIGGGGGHELSANNTPRGAGDSTRIAERESLRRSNLSPGPGSGSSVQGHQEGGAPAVRSNRRTTNTGRSMPLIRKLSSSDNMYAAAGSSPPTATASSYPSTTVNSYAPTLSQSDAGFSSGNSSPSPSALSHSPTTSAFISGASSQASTPPGTATTISGGGGTTTTPPGTAGANGSRSVSPVPPSTAGVAPTGLTQFSQRTVKPRRASLSIHSIKDLAQKSSGGASLLQTQSQL